MSGSGNRYDVLLSDEKPNKNKPRVSGNTDEPEASQPLFTAHSIYHGYCPGVGAGPASVTDRAVHLDVGVCHAA